MTAWFRGAGMAVAACVLILVARDVAAETSAPIVLPAKIEAARHPYDEAADGRQTLAAALADAKRTGKKVLVDFGANWCPDCRALGGIMADPGIKAYLAAHYEVAVIDVGRFNKNLDIAAAYGVKIHGIPTVMLIDPQSNQLLNPDGLEALGDAGTMAPQAVADQLVRWTERPAG